MMKVAKKPASLLLASALLLGACSGGGGGGPANAPAPADGGAGAAAAPQPQEAPLEVSIMTTFRAAEPPGKDNPIWKELESKLNAKLNVTWLSPNNYKDKMNVTLASGDIPDLMLIEDPYETTVVTMARQGAFWDLTPYLNDYPNLMAFPKDSWENIKIDGKVFGIVRARPAIGGYGTPIIRKDWLDKLGLPVPETMDDFYSVMKAFTERDPDGNGVKDTYGFIGYVDPAGMGRFIWVRDAFNHANGWKVEGDGIVHPDLLPGTREALVWLNRAYKEGLISPDFAVMKLSQMKDMLKAGKGGMFSESMQQAWILLSDLRKIEPNADYMPLDYVQGPSGKIVGRDSGRFGMYVIPKKVPEAKLKRILETMDQGSGEEISDIANYGIKDVHYTVRDGLKITNEQAIKDNVSQEIFGQIFLYVDKYMRGYATGIPVDFYNRNKKSIDEREKHSIADPSLNLISETGIKYKAEYDKKSQDLKTKIIMGNEPIEAWDRFVGELKADAIFQKYMAEMNESYKLQRGK